MNFISSSGNKSDAWSGAGDGESFLSAFKDETPDANRQQDT